MHNAASALENLDSFVESTRVLDFAFNRYGLIIPIIVTNWDTAAELH